jgi:hypothetical protein
LNIDCASGTATPIDHATPKCFDTCKAPNKKAPCVEIGESAMRGGKYYFSVAKNDTSSESNRKSPNSKHEKANSVEREKVRRHYIFKSDDWYEKAAPSMTIKR